MFFMKKLNSMTLDALRAVIPVLSEKEQSACIGGGSGSELTPFSMEEFTGLFHDGIWKGGYVQLENDGLSSSICYVNSTGGIENYSGDSAVGVKALAARIGSGSVDDEPTPNHDGCTCGADCDPCMTGSGCEDCLARLEGSGLIDDSGLIDNSGELDGICSGCTTCEESGSGCWSECETCHGDEEGDENVIELPEIIVTPGGNSGNSGGDNNSSGSGNSGTDFGGIIDDIINNNHNSGGNTGGTGNSGNNTSNGGNNSGQDDQIESDSLIGQGVVNIASKYEGFSEQNNMPQILEWLREAGYSNPNSETPWCAAFVSAVYREAGIDTVNSARVIDWKSDKFTTATNSPQVGDLAFFKGWSHIGIVSKVNGDYVEVIHGNSGSGTVKVSPMRKSSFTFRKLK